MRPNLFINNHEKICGKIDDDGHVTDRAGTGWENVFTEAVAFYLSTDQEVLGLFCRNVMGAARFEMPTRIETQYAQGTDRPDLFFELASGRALLLESKVDAPLGERQLERYLAMRPNGQMALVALFSKNQHNIHPEVLQEKERYLRPPDRGHFFWSDLYQWIPEGYPGGLGIPGLRYAFREYMELIRLGMILIPGNWQKLFEDRTLDENQRVQKEFGRRLARVSTYLGDLRFKMETAEHKAIVGYPLDPKPFHHVTIKPSIARKQYIEASVAREVHSAVMSVSLVYDSSEVPPHARETYARSGPSPLGKYRWVRVEPHQMTHKRIRAEFVCNLDQFLTDEARMESQLLDACRELLERILA